MNAYIVFVIMLALVRTTVAGPEDTKSPSESLPNAMLALSTVLPTKQEIQGFTISFLKGFIKMVLKEGEVNGLKSIKVVGVPERGKYPPSGEDVTTYTITFPELIVQYMTLQVSELEGFWATSIVKNKVKLVVRSTEGDSMFVHRILEVEVEQLEGFDLAEHSHCLGCQLALKIFPENLKKEYTQKIQDEVNKKLTDLIKKLVEIKFATGTPKSQKDETKPTPKKEVRGGRKLLRSSVFKPKST